VLNRGRVPKNNQKGKKRWRHVRGTRFENAEKPNGFADQKGRDLITVEQPKTAVTNNHKYLKNSPRNPSSVAGARCHDNKYLRGNLGKGVERCLEGPRVLRSLER